MKTLTLLRHAKSSWDNPLLDDIERPLSERGEKACRTIATAISRNRFCFDYIVVSPARRAQETASLVFDAVETVIKSLINIDQDLYTFSSIDLVQYISDLPDGYDDILLVGHNPAITVLVNRLVDITIDNVPTCGLVRILSTSDTWEGFTSGEIRILSYFTPKMEKKAKTT